jgi:hypothetical protein
MTETDKGNETSKESKNKTKKQHALDEEKKTDHHLLLVPPTTKKDDDAQPHQPIEPTHSSRTETKSSTDPEDVVDILEEKGFLRRGNPTRGTTTVPPPPPQKQQPGAQNVSPDEYSSRLTAIKAAAAATTAGSNRSIDGKDKKRVQDMTQSPVSQGKQEVVVGASLSVGPSPVPKKMNGAGAVSIDGPRIEELSRSLISVTNPNWEEGLSDEDGFPDNVAPKLTDAATHTVTQATLVDPEEQERQAEKIRKQAMNEFQSTAVRAQVLDETEERKRRRRTILCFAAILVIVIAVAVSVIVTLVGKDDDEILTRIQIITVTVEDRYGKGVLDDEFSAQYEALDWMAVNDTYLELPLETEKDLRLFHQRWVMCVLAFSTGIDTWTREDAWLDPVDECTWSGITCDANGDLVAVNTRKFRFVTL